MNHRNNSRRELNHPSSGTFSASDFPVDDQGRIYHLQVKPGQIAPNVILVGDPGRAEMIGSTYLRDIELEHEHRGLVTVTGTSVITGDQATIINPVRTTAATSGIGTPSLEIVLIELMLLMEIDFQTRRRKPDFPRLHIIRVGTSGALQATTKLGTPIITTYAIGMDNTGLFYETPYPDEVCQRLETELGMHLKDHMETESRFYGKLHPYVARAEPKLVQALVDAAQTLGVKHKLGLTVSNAGFFLPQGRETVRVKPSIHDLDLIFSKFDPQVDDQRVENMEMEASFLLHLSGGLRHWAGVICPAIANRRDDTFDPNYQESVHNAIQVALLALAMLRDKDVAVD